MPFVRLSGTVQGVEDPNREMRARMLYQLFANGWDIYNSNGDQRISLSNIEKKIKESDAFVFMPGATLEDLFKAVSIFVGYQTMDEYLFGKPAVILNSDGSWDGLLHLLDTLQAQGSIRQNYRQFLLETKDAEEVLSALDQVKREGLPDVGRPKITECRKKSYQTPKPLSLLGSACVFCSASLEDKDFLQAGFALGRLLAEKKIGCVTGAGKSGIMGAVVNGSVQASGWTGGSNVPHIIEMEGLPEGLSSFWLRGDIYTRMEVMIKESDAFIIFPGGAGTVQEMLALLIFKQLDSDLMKAKPVVIYNPLFCGTKTGFWDRLIELLQPWARQDLFEVVDDLGTVVDRVEEVLSSRFPNKCAS